MATSRGTLAIRIDSDPQKASQSLCQRLRGESVGVTPIPCREWLRSNRRALRGAWTRLSTSGTEGQPGPVTQQTADSCVATFDTNVPGTLLSMKPELRVTQGFQ
jgi:hypothetical protein